MRERGTTILLSAGEASGDRLGAGLARALAAREGDLRLVGMGGPAMADAGVRIVQDAGQVAVVGVVEVLSRLSAIRRAMARLERYLDEQRPDLLVAIDYPDFNLRLAARARKAGVPVVYFVSPQIWAWRRGRIRTVRRLVRRMLVLFPFEVGFYEAAGVPVTLVGHPAAELAAPSRPLAELRERLGIGQDRRAVALLPGSRPSEVSRLLGPMLDAAAILRRTHADLQFVVPIAPGLDDSVVRDELARRSVGEVILHRGDFPEVLSLCQAGAVASGTASLEAALAGLPIVVVYRMSGLSYVIARLLVRLDHIALPNLVAGRRVVPELVQGECRGGRIAAELARYLDDEAHARSVGTALAGIRSRLGGPGVFDRAADATLAELAKSGGDGPP